LVSSPAIARTFEPRAGAIDFARGHLHPPIERASTARLIALPT
jgi:hypothetical protein